MPHYRDCRDNDPNPQETLILAAGAMEARLTAPTRKRLVIPAERGANRTRNISLLSFLILMMLIVLYFTGTFSAAAQDIPALRYGEPVDGALAAGQTVEYRFMAEAGDPVIVIANAKGGEIDPFVQLLTAEGALIAEDDDSGGKYNARIEDVTLNEAGEYRVRVTNAAEGGGGNYSLIVNNAAQVIAYHGGGDEPSTVDPGYLGYQLSEPWHTTNLTYLIVNVLPMFPAEEVEQVIAESFQAWSNNTPLTFTRVYDESANIVVQFTSIDGSSQVLGQACPPSSPCAGSVEFDIDENWILYEPQQYNDISLLGVATHEFGHIVGLLHSSDTSALMYPQYSPYNLQPSNDDIAGVQRLYGAGRGGVIGQPTTPPGGGSGEGEGNVVTGFISDSQYVEFWDFDVSAGEYVTITMEALSGGLDPLLVIIDQNNQVLAYDDDSAGNLNAVVRNIRFPSSGTYTAAATRFEQAQGYTEGEYQLSLDFGFTDAPEGIPTSVANSPSAPTGGGAVDVSGASQTDLTSRPNLASVMDRSFIDSVTPLSQSAPGTVSASQPYVWSVTWCATTQQALERSLNNIDVSFDIEGQSVPANSVSLIQRDADGLACADYAVLLSGWSGQSVILTATMRLSAPTFDGRAVYQPGDYVYEYAVRVR